MLALALLLASLQSPELRWHDCPGRAATPVRCGTLLVPEDHERPTSRRIRLQVIVAPAREKAKPDPLLLLFGGPGDFGSGRIDALLGEHREANARRDIIVLDQRGTGASSPIACLYGSDQRIQDYLVGFLAPGFGTRCRETFAQRADLARYRTVDFVRDIESLRRAMNLPALNLSGGSYGTRVALHYAARYPDAVRTLTLQGVVPPSFVMPASFAADAQRALDLVFDDCRADAACNRAFPRLRADFDSVSRQLDRGVVTTTVVNPVTRLPEQVTLSRLIFAEAVRAMLYTPEGARRLPLAVHNAARGNYSAFASVTLARHRDQAQRGTLGLYLAVTCAEDIPRLDVASARSQAVGFLREIRLSPHLEACAGWPRRPTSDEWPPIDGLAVPTLIFVGDYDPVTPPSWARATAATLRSSRVVVVPRGGHGFAGMQARTCVASITVAFLDGRNPAAPDARCVERLVPPPFAIPARPGL